jgi:hypothetical protein
MIHIGTIWMNRVPQGMSFIQVLLFQGLFLWHDQFILEAQCSLRILVETSNLWVTFLYPSLDVCHTLIIFLGCIDLTLQGGCEGDVV